MLSTSPHYLVAIRGYEFRPFEDRWPAEGFENSRADELPSVTKAARRLVSRSKRTQREARLLKRLA